MEYEKRCVSQRRDGPSPPSTNLGEEKEGWSVGSVSKVKREVIASGKKENK